MSIRAGDFVDVGNWFYATPDNVKRPVTPEDYGFKAGDEYEVVRVERGQLAVRNAAGVVVGPIDSRRFRRTR